MRFQRILPQYPVYVRVLLCGVASRGRAALLRSRLLKGQLNLCLSMSTRG